MNIHTRWMHYRDAATDDKRQAKMRTLARDVLGGKLLLGNFLPEQLEALLEQWGQPRYRAQQLLQGYLAERRFDLRTITTLPGALRQRCAEAFIALPLELSSMKHATDGTVKMLVRLLDGAQVEMVRIPREMQSGRSRRTLCISTQAGCPLGCVFCATATLKLQRNLETAEIVGQFLLAEQVLGERITNVVFMGMGEPLLNYEAVTAAIRLMTWGTQPLVTPRHITLSTAGIVPAIARLAEEPISVKLAISLHATTDELRRRLMPIARRWSIAELLDAAEYYYRVTKRDITYEYILFDRLNDSEADARRLVRIARRVPSKVNVIPFHPIDFTHPSGLAAELRPASGERLKAFVEMLRRAGIPTMVRSSSGIDIAAACGQLALAELKTSR
ncbi:MAG: 23S rRNA (adenine(2503)-C(2))-methyltransferase RlmN [Chlorobiota bacterium]|jgi:23S rRNA (adenine2503-C2)-methyltransferase|nr:MAG: 23S rRNA (adenine(2503)-C(2))-methyltransferase RlmN [Chlorobiota bacterium]